MSLIHLEKSVLTFHLKEILEDGHGNHPLAWVGLGILILGPKVFPAVAKVTQPATQNLFRSRRSRSPLGYTPMSLSQWIAEAHKRELVVQEDVAIADHSTPISTAAPQESNALLIQ
jgi:hypothetical protein